MTCHGLRPLARWRDYLYLARKPEKISNYALGLINVTLFAIIFFQIQLYASLLLQLFFCGQYLRVVRVVSAEQPAGGRAADPLVTLAESHRPVCRVCGRHWFNDGLHQPGICFPDPYCCGGHVRHRVTGDNACASAGCFPVLGFLHDGVVHCGDDPDDP